jgi:hypothetical protein
MALFLSQIKIFALIASSEFFPNCPLLSELQNLLCFYLTLPPLIIILLQHLLRGKIGSKMPEMPI